MRSSLEIEVPPLTDEGQTKEQVSLDWDVISFTAEKLTIQINFSRPYDISSSADTPNTLRVNVNKATGFFERKQDGFKVQVPVRLETQLPRMAAKSLLEQTASMASTVSSVGKSSLWIIIVLQFFKKIALNNVLG